MKMLNTTRVDFNARVLISRGILAVLQGCDRQRAPTTRRNYLSREKKNCVIFIILKRYFLLEIGDKKCIYLK